MRRGFWVGRSTPPLSKRLSCSCGAAPSRMAALAVNKPGAGVDSGRQGSRGTAVVKVSECGVCEDVFSLQGDKVPRLLLCGHTVCHDCLTRLPSHGRAIRCPFDRQVTDLGVYQYLRPGLVEGVNRLSTSILAS